MKRKKKSATPESGKPPGIFRALKKPAPYWLELAPLVSGGMMLGFRVAKRLAIIFWLLVQ
jgi:hypothetical protein